MENLSHSLRHNKLSRKPSHTNAAAKGIYDDVFGGPPKFGVPAALSPRAEDYKEIFGGFHAPRVSSIPVLDLPVVDEPEVFFDVRSPGFDYSEVFGGIKGLDFAHGYEELFGQWRGGSAGCGSSDEAWYEFVLARNAVASSRFVISETLSVLYKSCVLRTPAGSGSLSEESDHSGSNQGLSNGDSHHLFDGNIEYNISYHKANPRSNAEITNGLRRTAEIQAVPGYCYMVDRMDPYQLKEKHLKKTRSDNLNGRNDVRRQKDYGRINSCPGGGFVTISEVSLRTEPSHLPPPLRPPPPASVGDISRPVSNWNSNSMEENGSDGSTSSPPFFDVEVDASSSAAAVASAAAMKEAMVKAQAQLRSAKELMERKKEGRHNRARSGSSCELRDMGTRRPNESTVQGTGRGEGSEIKNFILEDPRGLSGTKCSVQDSLGGEKLQSRPKRSEQKMRGKESALNEMFAHFEEAGEWKEATQFFELVRADGSGAVLAQTEKEKDLSEKVRTRDNGEMEQIIEGFEGQNFNKKKASAQKRVPNEDYVPDAKNISAKAAKEVSVEKNIEKNEKAAQDIGHWEEAKTTHMKPLRDRDTVMKLNGSDSSEDRESSNDVLIEVVREFEVRQVMESKRDGSKSKKSSGRLEAKEKCTEGHGKGRNEKRTKDSIEREEKERIHESVIEPTGNEKRRPELSRHEEDEFSGRVNLEYAWEEAAERGENERRLKAALELEEYGKRMREVFEKEEEKKLKEADELEENKRKVKENLELAENKRKQDAAAREERERRLKEALEREENERRFREAHEREENEKKLREAREQEEMECRRKETLEQEERECRTKEARVQEEKEKRLKEALEREERECRRKEALEQEEKEKRLKEALEREERECRRKEALEQEEKEKRLKEALAREDRERRRNEALEEEKNKRLKETLEQEESEERLNEASEKEQMKKGLEEAQEVEENERRLREAHEREEIEERIHEAKGRGNSDNNLQEASQDEDNGSNVRDSCTDERIGTRSERDYDQGELDDAVRDTFELEELDKWLKEAVDVLSEPDEKGEECMRNVDVNIRSDFPSSGSEQVSRESRASVDASNDDGDRIMSESQSSKNKSPAAENEEHGSKAVDSTESARPDDLPKPTKCENPKVFSQVSYNSTHREEKSAQEWGETKENVKKSEARFGEDGQKVEIPQPAVLNAQRTSRQWQSASQAEVRKENLNGTVKAQEKDAERLRREQEMEKERLRKIEEEREREREREKDRMAVDRATLEARERAYVEARERAERAAVERATAEARQRSLAEARERLEKACAEARERSFLEKTSMEARIRAERAAVERATAEARERAASRYNGMRQSSLPSDFRESQLQTAGSSGSARFQYSSGYGASYDTEKPEGVEGESAQRCRARLERHRRTAERAAKALAEKNMRDLLAQREQAERNRLAETLDADVKRWSSGKEGNLRALLSTLQYILGPDSGWQPVPLTEVITSAAVKKAYRKATLSVHPDKLQQRGASIQQKYICEKVFDLLKEAWNKFNSEER
ncbi:hypothetical protein CDL15_Pgr013605 [Punica granatum]|uniref:J domain-containing protein n=1 Tax=Punica granatum TaxID=22663 RepID=A0A218W1P8_PUNGR|nr:hypothetical protein CDL15_Pgr013605 [Punica granatum]